MGRDGKHSPLRQIDERPPFPVGGLVPAADPSSGSRAIKPPAAPTNLSLATGLEQIAASYKSYIDAFWDEPSSFIPSHYDVYIRSAQGTSYLRADHSDQAALDSSQQSIHIPGLVDNTTYYVAVRSVSRSGAVSAWTAEATITTAADTTPPGLVTGIAADFTSASLILTGTTPSDADLRDLLISIWADATKAVNYLNAAPLAVKPGSAFRFEWSEADNKRAVGINGDPSVYCEVAARDAAANIGTAVNITATNAVPGDVAGLAQSWNGDAGAAGADLVLSWTANTDRDLRGYQVTIDSVVQGTILGTSYTYPFGKNQQDHAGTADPVLSVSVVAIDAYSQVSATPATATATNAAPAAPGSVAITGYVGTAAVDITATKPKDFAAFRVRVIRDGGTVETVDTQDELYTLNTAVRGSYQVGVKVVDVFGQESSETLSGVAALDPLSIDYLRAYAFYVDSDGSTSPTLDVLKDNTGNSGGSTHSADAWHWTEQQWPWVERVKTVTLAAGGASMLFVVGVSTDGTTYTYYYGTPDADGNLPSATSVLATAQAGAGMIGVYDTLTRVQFPIIAQARYVRLYHRYVGSIYVLREFYARRLVQSDDIEAESIRAINIAASAIVADKIAANAVTATKIEATAIDGKTITGATIRTSASNPRVEMTSSSLRTYDGSGVVQIEALTSNNGKLTAGAGLVVLDANGIRIESTTAAQDIRSYSFLSGSDVIGGIYGYDVLSTNWITVHAKNVAAKHGYAAVVAESPSGYASTIDLIVNRAPSTSATVRLIADGSGTTFSSNATANIVTGGFNVGSATGAGTGEIKTSGNVALNGAGINSGIGLMVRGEGTTGATAALRCENTSSTELLTVYDNGDIAASNAASRDLLLAATGNTTYSRTRLLCKLSDATVVDWRLVADGGAGGDFVFYGGTGASLGTRLVIGANGNMAIGDAASNTTDRLRVTGQGTSSSTYGIVVKSSAGASNMWVRDDGGCWAATPAWNSSDIRLKDDIDDIDTSDDRIDRLTAKRYRRKKRDGSEELEDRHEFGVLAQDLQPLYPELVMEVPAAGDSTELAINYTGLHTLQLARQQAEIAQLQQRISQLEAAIERR